MGRIRTIKPEFPQSESMGGISRDARLLFLMLFTVVDDEGRARAAPRMLASVLFPYYADAPMRIPEWMDELESKNCVIVYAIADHTYLQIVNWTLHQRIDKPTKSKFPAPPGHKKPRQRSVKAREASRALHDNSRLDKEGKGEDLEKERNGDVSAEPSALAPAVISLPTNRFDATGEEVGFSQADLNRYGATYPAVDVPQQFREMRQWLLDNRDRRKTALGMRKFANNWLGREQDKPGGNQSRTSPFPTAKIHRVVE